MAIQENKHKMYANYAERGRLFYFFSQDFGQGALIGAWALITANTVHVCDKICK